MNELQFTHKIRLLLDEGAHLDAGTSEHLRAARERALAGIQHAPRKRRTGIATGWNLGFRFARMAIPVVVLAAGVLVIAKWQDGQRAAEVEELDALLLSEDLPIDAYLDRGFEAWLRRRG